MGQIASVTLGILCRRGIVAFAGHNGLHELDLETDGTKRGCQILDMLGHSNLNRRDGVKIGDYVNFGQLSRGANSLC